MVLDYAPMYDIHGGDIVCVLSVHVCLSVHHKSLYAQLILHFISEFLKILHSCFLVHMKILISLHHFYHTIFFMELFPFLTLNIKLKGVK